MSDSCDRSDPALLSFPPSLQASRGPLTDAGLSGAEERCELRGAAAIMMLLPLLQAEQAEQDVPLLSALLQLKQLQQISSWNCPLPLVVLVPWQRGAADAERLEEGDSWEMTRHRSICSPVCNSQGSVQFRAETINRD